MLSIRPNKVVIGQAWEIKKKKGLIII